MGGNAEVDMPLAECKAVKTDSRSVSHSPCRETEEKMVKERQECKGRMVKTIPVTNSGKDRKTGRNHGISLCLGVYCERWQWIKMY